MGASVRKKKSCVTLTDCSTPTAKQSVKAASLDSLRTSALSKSPESNSLTTRADGFVNLVIKKNSYRS